MWRLTLPERIAQLRVADARKPEPAPKPAAAAGKGTSRAAERVGKSAKLQAAAAQSRERGAARRKRLQKPPKLKEVRLTEKCAEHDMLTKVRAARAFLEKGAVVRVIALLRGGANLATAEPSEVKAARAAASALVERFIRETADCSTSNGVGGRGPSVSTTLTPKTSADE